MTKTFRLNSRAWALAMIATLSACATYPPPATPPADGFVIAAPVVPATPHVNAAQQTAFYWAERAEMPDMLVLSADAIAAQNARLFEQDHSVFQLRNLPAQRSREDVRGLVAGLSKLPERTLYDVGGKEISASQRNSWVQGLALDAIPANVRAQPGLVVHRSDLRTFPTVTRVFNSRGDTDIDRFQESAMFPGTPVWVLHRSRDGEWLFVQSPRYAAWTRADAIATGDAEDVFGYATRAPFVVVTGATTRTVYTPDIPALSELQLDMGTRVPWLSDWPSQKPVNGQMPASARVVQLPVRGNDGRLSLQPALLQQRADAATDYLPLTQRFLLEQSFKFLGERYGWGHSYNARDCSGFVSDVYASFGVQMPRNTGDQAKSPAYNRIEVAKDMPREARRQLMATLQPGDLIYMPGHVMRVVGHENGMTYVIHDTPGVRIADAAGTPQRYPLNGVSVTPFEPLISDGDTLYLDRVTSIQRIRP